MAWGWVFIFSPAPLPGACQRLLAGPEGGGPCVGRRAQMHLAGSQHLGAHGVKVCKLIHTGVCEGAGAHTDVREGVQAHTWACVKVRELIHTGVCEAVQAHTQGCVDAH